MGRRKAGVLFCPREASSGVFVPGRLVEVDGDQWVTCLGIARINGRNRVAVWWWDRVEWVTYRRTRVRSGQMPIVRRDPRGYRRVVLGASHPLANAAGYQYEHRLTALGQSGSLPRRVVVSRRGQIPLPLEGGQRCT